MIVIPAMHDAVCDFLTKEVADRALLRTPGKDAKDVQMRNPIVFRAGTVLPRKIGGRKTLDYAYPFICPRTWKIENVKDKRESIATMDILIGVYDPGAEDEEGNLIDDGSGFRDFWNLVESIRLALFENPVIAKRFRIVDFEAELIDEDIYPFYEGFCQTKWEVIYPMPKLQEHMF